MSARAAEAAGVAALAFVLAVALAAPVLQAPSERVFGRESVGRHHDPFTAMGQFGRPLAFGVYTQPLTDVPGALLSRVSTPVAAYNWLVLLTFPLSAAAAYVLGRHLRLGPAGAGFAAMAFAFSPFHLAQAAYHPHIAQTQWLPLYLFALWRSLERPKPAALVLLAVSAAGVTLSNFYGGLIAAVITPAAMAAYWFFVTRGTPRSARRLALTTGVLAAVGAAGIAYAWAAAHAVLSNPGAFAYARADLLRYSARWWSYLVPPIGNPLLGAGAMRVWQEAGVHEGLLEQQVSLGWGVVALGLVAVFAWQRRDRRVPPLAAVPVLAAVAVFALACSLSPEGTIGGFSFTRPSGLLHGWLPMFRSYARFGAIVQLMAVLLAAIGAERLWRSGRPLARAACAMLVALAAFEYAVWPPAMWRDVLPTSAHRWVASQPGPVRALDCALLGTESASVQWLSGGRITLRTQGSDDCAQPNIADKLSAEGYTHLLVRRHPSEQRWFAALDPPAGLTSAASFRDGRVFAVSAGTPAVYTVRMDAFYPRERDDAWDWRWMGGPASWTIANISGGPVVALLDVEMTAFHEARGLTVLLDGRAVQSLTVEAPRRTHRLGPLPLTPGEHEITFRPAGPPSIADAKIHNGDRRLLSFAIGAWRWRVAEVEP